MPRVEHSCSMSCTDCAHLGESGGPTRKNHPGSGLGWPGSSLLGSNEWQSQIYWGRSTAKWEASINVIVISPIDSEELPVFMPNRDHAKSRL